LTEVSAELTALYVFDWQRFSIAPLVSVGAGFLHQKIVPSNCPTGTSCPQTDAHPNALITTVGAWLLAPLGRGFTLEGTAELANFYARIQRDPMMLDPRAGRLGVLTYRLGLGVGYRY
jgi:hypothetical protein